MSGAPEHRLSAKAVIVRNGRLLVIRRRDADGDWYVLPGGGQRPGEELADALRRECREELGCEVEVGRILWARDYIDAHHPFPHGRAGLHQVELMFECALAPGSRPATGAEPDDGQLDACWLPVAELPRQRLYPVVLRERIARGLPRELAEYLGDVY